MRLMSIAVMCAVALAACGESSKQEPTADAVPAAVTPPPIDPLADAPAWRKALTMTPQLAGGYSNSVGALPGSKVETTPEGDTRITTTKVNGGWAGMRVLGEEARAVPQAALRLKVQVESGAAHFMTTYDQAPSGYEPADEVVTAGEAKEIYLPVDQKGPPLFVVANANGEGPSVAKIISIELVAPPGVTVPAAGAAAAPATAPARPATQGGN